MKKNRLILFTIFLTLLFTINLFADDLADMKSEIEMLKSEVEMQQMLMDELMTSGTNEGPKAKFGVNGFIEFRYENMAIKELEWDAATNPNGSLVTYGLWDSEDAGKFQTKNLNLYFDFEYGAKVRSFVEVKLLRNPTGDGEFLFDQRTVANDGNGSFISFGSIYTERSWIDYKFSDNLKIKLGKFFTPYGIWNVEHGAPILPSIRVPATIAYGMMPNRQVGINIHGDKLFGNWGVNYNLFVSNGRAMWESIEDNENKAVGLSFNIDAPCKALDRLQFGFAYYKGRETLEGQQKYYVYDAAGNRLTYYDTIKNGLEETVFACHLSTAYKKWELNAEYVKNDIEYDNANSIDNLNYRMFYRPENTGLIEGTTAKMSGQVYPGLAQLGLADDTPLTQVEAVIDGKITGLTQLAGGVSQYIAGGVPEATTLTAFSTMGAQQAGLAAMLQASLSGITGASTLSTALTTANGTKSTIETNKPALLAGISVSQNLFGNTTVGDLKNQKATDADLTDPSATKYGYAMPLVSLDVKRTGFYTILRYNLTSNFFPYFVYEKADPGPNDAFPKATIYMAGLNYKPVPVVTCKFEVSRIKFEENTPLYTGYTTTGIDKIGDTRNEDFDYLQMSVSYAF